MSRRIPARLILPLKEPAGTASHIISGEDDAVRAQFEHAKIVGGRGRLGLGGSRRDEDCGERD